MTHTTRMAYLLLLALTGPALASGQRASGTVRVTGSGAALSGAVVSVLDAVGQPAGRTLTNERGEFSILIPPTGISLRVMRIGYRPANVVLNRRAGLDVNIDIAMERVPVLLDAVRVVSDARCGNSPDGLAALALWEQARAALLTAIVAREANPAEAMVMRYEREIDPRRGMVKQQRVLLTKGKSSRPIVAGRTGAELAADGYMRQQADGDVYYAPDADVLFDATFTGSHCFGVRRGKDEHQGHLGLTFVPRNRGSRNVDVDGVLWVSPTGPELVQVDYGYTGIDPEAAKAGSGGTMHFQTMANGVVFIDSWTISLPVVQRVAVAGRMSLGGDARTRVVALSETGGFVLSAQWADNTQWQGKIGGITGEVVEKGTNAPVKGAEMTLGGVMTTLTDESGLYSFAPMPPGRYELTLLDSTFGQYLRPRHDAREVVITRSDTVTARFDVPPRTMLIDALCKEMRATRGNAVLLGRITDGSDAAPTGLVVESSWLANYDRAQSGRSGNITVTEGRQSVEVDDRGRFFACGVARNRPVTLRARLGSGAIADTVIDANDSPGAVRIVEWKVSPGIFAAAQRDDASSFRGRVVSNGNPVAGVEVWVIPANVSAKTDSLGQFRLVGLRSGPQIVQLRRLGLAVTRDSITLQGGKETIRDFVLDGTTLLDTVRTVGRNERPALQEFERRRAIGLGTFIAEDELKKQDNLPLGTLLRSRLPGSRIVNYNGALHLAALRGGAALHLANSMDPRSPRGCWASVYLDGTQMFKGGQPDPPDLTTFQVSTFSGIEYYAGGASMPLEYNSSHPCGLLLLWTRRR